MSAAPGALPDLEPLARLCARLERAGVAAALGGSGLLVAHGLAAAARDWDLTTDAPLERVVAALGELPHRRFGASGIHADHKLALESGAIEVIVGFALLGPRGTVRLPTRVASRWRGLPVGSPEVWAAAYALLGRDAKAELLLGWLQRHGAEAEPLALLAGQPLPAPLARRLASLPVRGGPPAAAAGPSVTPRSP